MTQLLENQHTKQKQCTWFIHVDSIKRYMILNVIGGFAFFALGKLLFHSALLCLLCNVAATQMLHYVLPTGQ